MENGLTDGANAETESEEYDDPVSGQDQLDALKELDERLIKLERLVFRATAADQITEKDEGEYKELVEECQPLYGRVRTLLGSTVVEQLGRRQEVFQFILTRPSISEMIYPFSMMPFWRHAMAGARSSVRQAIGELEQQQRQDRIALPQDTVERYQGLIVLLERLRTRFSGITTWLSERPLFLDKWIDHLEGSRWYRLARIVTTFQAFLWLSFGIIIIVVGAAIAITH